MTILRRARHSWYARKWPSWSARQLAQSLLAGQLLSASLLAQASQPVVVPDAPSCAQCTVVMRRIGTLGTADTVGFIASPVRTVAVDHQRRYWVLSGDELPLVFDSTGRFITRVGRQGQGPGEFMRPLEAVPIPGDSVLVIDGELARGTVVAPDLTPVRTIQLIEPLRPLIVVSWPDSVIGNGSIGQPSSVGWPLHHISFRTRDAEVLSSFGPDSGDVRPFEGPRLEQVLGPPQRGGFWSADVLRYRLTRWSSIQTRQITLERRPRWFAQESRYWIGNPTTPPPPAVSAIAEDDSGRVWVFVRIAAPTWRDGWPGTGGAEYSLSKIALEKMFRTTIEVIDVKVQRVVARVTTPYWVIAALPGARAAAYAVDSDGVPHIEVLQFDVTRRAR